MNTEKGLRQACRARPSRSSCRHRGAEVSEEAHEESCCHPCQTALTAGVACSSYQQYPRHGTPRPQSAATEKRPTPQTSQTPTSLKALRWEAEQHSVLRRERQEGLCECKANQSGLHRKTMFPKKGGELGRRRWAIVKRLLTSRKT